MCSCDTKYNHEFILKVGSQHKVFRSYHVCRKISAKQSLKHLYLMHNLQKHLLTLDLPKFQLEQLTNIVVIFPQNMKTKAKVECYEGLSWCI